MLHLPDLDYLGVAISAHTEKPELTAEAIKHAGQALRLFGHPLSPHELS